MSMKDELRKAVIGEKKESKNRLYPIKGDVLFHKKGICYVVLNLATHTETHQPMVVLQQVNNPDILVKPAEMFTSDEYTVMFNLKMIKGLML